LVRLAKLIAGYEDKGTAQIEMTTLSIKIAFKYENTEDNTQNICVESCHFSNITEIAVWIM
jgi:hypothetical protein